MEMSLNSSIGAYGDSAETFPAGGRAAKDPAPALIEKFLRRMFQIIGCEKKSVKQHDV
jgi:hypothetical protein